MEDFLYRFLNIYERCPVWLQNISGMAYRALPTAIRYGQFYHLYEQRIRKFLTNPEQANALQRELLMDQVNRAIKSTPFYKKYSPIKTMEDFRKLPIISKQDILQNAEQFHGQIPENMTLRANTGGSSGTPMTFLIHKNRTRPKEYAHFNWFWHLYGYRPGDRMVMMRGKPLKDNRLFQYRAVKNCLNISCYEISARNIDAVLHEISRFKPAFVHAYPSAVQIFMKCCGNRPRHYLQTIKALFLGSEFLSSEDRSLIEKFFNAPVCSWYGHSECAVMGGNLPGSNQFAFFPFYGYIELLDDENQPVTVIGQSGRIIATSFDNDAQPFLRYDTGDRGTLGNSYDFQGIKLFTLDEIEGRGQDEIFLEDGRSVTLTAFIFGQHLPAFEKIKELQLEQFQPGKLQINLVPLNDFQPEDISQLISSLEQSVSNNIKINVNVVSHIEKTIRGKHRFLIQHVKK